MFSFSCESITASISVPSASSSTLQLLAQILSMGETDESEGLETTMSNLNELHSIFTLLGMNVKLCPKLSSSKLAIESVDYEVVAVRDEVLKVDDTQFREIEVQDHVGLSVKKNSTTEKCSPLKKKEKITLFDDKKNVKMSCKEFDPSFQVNQRCENVRFKQSGLLQDFKVNLMECSPDGALEGDAMMCKTSEVEGDKSLLQCNVCGVQVNKHVGLRRHYQQKHGIQNDKSLNVNECFKCNKRFSSRRCLLRHFRRVHKDGILPRKKVTPVKVQHQEVNKRQKESEGCTKMDVLSNDILCGASFNHNHSLNTHEWRVHECQECDLSFKYKSSLRSHRRSVHEGKKYGCGVCDKILASRDGMRKHCSTSGHDRDLIYVVVDLP